MGPLFLWVFASFCGHSSVMKVVVLCSGGMDSVTALYWARANHAVAAVLSFEYGAKHNHQEIPFAVEHAAKIAVSTD